MNWKRIKILSTSVMLLSSSFFFIVGSTHSKASGNAVFTLHNPDVIMENTLLNPFVGNTDIKILGDSITAGVGSTGYKLTSTKLGNTGYFVATEESGSWANLLKKDLESRYNKSLLVHPLDPRIITTKSRLENKDTNAKLKMSAFTKGVNSWKLSFAGTEFKVYFTKQSGSGIVGIYIDGKKVGVYDLYSAKTENGFEVQIAGLQDSNHNIEIKTEGKNKDSVSDRVYIEAFEFKKSVSIKNWGVSGRDSEWLLANFNTLIQPNDDIIMIQIGTNDRIDFTSPEALKLHLKSIIDKCVSLKKEVILLSANPTSQSDDDTTKETRKFTMRDVDMTIKQVAKEYGIKHISNYDAFLRYSEATGETIDALLADGLHPNDTGYKIMYKNVMRHLDISL
jgi:lysophospholipase L1-like esterase